MKRGANYSIWVVVGFILAIILLVILFIVVKEGGVKQEGVLGLLFERFLRG